MNMKRTLLVALVALVPLWASADQVLREDTATQIAIGPFLDGTDGVTAETALTVTEWDCDIVKHANSGMAATALTITASGGSNDAAHLQSGMYSLELTATDTETAGRLTIVCDHATPATFIPVRQTYMVMPTQKFDSLYGTDVLQAHVVEYTAGVITATAIATDAITAAKIAADAIGASELAADAIASSELAATAVTEIQSGLATAAALATVATEVGDILTDTADMQPKLGTYSDLGSGATLAGNLEDMRDDGTATFSRTTDSLQAIRDRGDSAWVTGGGGACTADVGCIADGTAAAVTSTTLDMASGETFADDELIGATVVIASASTGAGQARLILDNAATNDRLTVDAWTTTPTGTVTYRVFSTPPGSSSSPVPANTVQIEGSDATDQINAAADLALSDYDPPTNAELITAVANVSVDELQASALADLFNTDSGTTYGSAVSGSVVAEIADNAGGSALTEAGIADAVWDELQSGHVTSGSFGEVATEVAALQTYLTNNLGTAGAAATEAGGDGDHLTEAGGTGDQLTAVAWNAAWDAEVQSEATDALNAYDPPTNTEMTAAIDALPTAAENTADVLSQQRVITGTCDSGSTTTCVDNALTQAAESQLDDRLICFDDSWCALITGFTPGTDTVTTTKTAPTTRASKGYTIYPATAQ